ncbi:M24 family metallopeptidase [Oceanomicrobium pacificus]|uniref:M24 family metallopeptidase n=1 Tax=Oceanomicrobium pacificus TaxID=2692916 RepID=A0A6B0TJF8_9RHOB|nr:M24 family metallopeptidase [Oceanomicrobium pacificus]MXU64557.1 M24 family metallopeptidase [Oceanomicrobium pacificus]
MTAPDLPFDRPEYNRRLRLVRAEMEARELDLLFIEDPSNMAWLTGYDGWSFYVHQGVIVRRTGNPIWWGRAMDAAGARRTVWMGEECIAGYDDSHVQNPSKHAMEDLAARIHDLGLSAARIGVEMDNYYFSARAFLTLQRDLPNAVLVDATGLVNWQRLVKSPAEITFMRRAAAISEHMVDGWLDRAEPGMAKNDLVAGILSDAVRGADGHWGDYAAIVPMLPSGADAAAPHLTWNGAALQPDEATFFELSGCYRRYHAPLSRTLYFGTPPDEMRRAEAAVVAGLEAGIAAARPGATAGDVAAALFDTFAAHGIEKDSRCGYPVGLSYPPDWGERTASFRRGDGTVLEPGMTFHFMPGVWSDSWGLEITETILIREDGPAEALCDRPRALFVK